MSKVIERLLKIVPLNLSIFLGFILLTTSCSVSKIKYGQNTIDLNHGEVLYFLEQGSPNSDILLLAFQGSDCNSVLNAKFIENVRTHFRPMDLLFIEKPGITPSLAYDPNPERDDCPPQYLEQDNPQRRAEDALAVIHAVQSKREYKNIVVLGGSEGGLVAVLVAAKSDEVNAVISINAGGAYFIDDVLHNIRATSPPEKLEEELAGFKGFASHVADSEPSPLVVSNHGFLWWQVALGLDQSEFLKRIQAPVLIIQSENDESVSPAHTMEMFNNLQELGYGNIELLTYANLDHALTDSDGKSHVSEVLNDANNWLNRVLLRSLRLCAKKKSVSFSCCT